MKTKMNGIQSKTSAFRILKQNSITSSLTAPIRLAPNWSRVLGFANGAKFKTDDFLQVNFNCFHFFNINISQQKPFIDRNIRENFENAVN